jgi:hypothetical protein
MNEHAAALRDNIAEAVASIVEREGGATFDDLDKLASALECLAPSTPVRRNATVDAGRALWGAVDELADQPAKAATIARECLTKLVTTDARFARLAADDVLAALRSHDRTPRTASTKGKRSLAGILADLAKKVGALDIAPRTDRASAVATVEKRFRRAKR